MSSITRFIVLTICVLLPAPNLIAQASTLRLWPNAIPGRIDNPAYRPGTITLNNGALRMVRIVEPTLDCYPLPAAQIPRAAIVICPGGGYMRLADDHEGTQVAQWLNSAGVVAFVLKYRMPSDSIMADKMIGPLQDGQKAMRIVRRHAKEWGIDPGKIGVMGFSAGGHLAASVSTRFAERVYDPVDSTSARPDFSVLIYPVISMASSVTHKGSRDNLLGPNPDEEQVRRASNEQQVTTETPPAFLVHAADDGTVSPENSILYFRGLRAHGVPVELHVYEKGGHGFGLGRTSGTESSWPAACLAWMKARGIL
jgi:acetyl esterase/lipase